MRDGERLVGGFDRDGQEPGQQVGDFGEGVHEDGPLREDEERVGHVSEGK